MVLGKKIIGGGVIILALSASAGSLRLPPSAAGPFPHWLSQTGAFKDVQTLAINTNLLPYELNAPFWSDGAEKWRWLAPAAGDSNKIQFAQTGEWKFPAGTIFVKHFELPTDESHPDVRRRLETRFLVCGVTGTVYGVTYKWRADNSDAELLETNLFENIAIQTPSGVRTQTWYYPSRADCLTCHTPLAGGVLGVTARQLNRKYIYPDSQSDNQLVHWNRLKLFAGNWTDEQLLASPQLADLRTPAGTPEHRARSWLDANCANCHRPGGTVASFDARFDTPLAQQNLVNGSVLIDQGIDAARIIAPNDIWRSILFMRVNTVDAIKMPPLARGRIDPQGTELLRAWIESLPAPPTLPPPAINPGGEFKNPQEVRITHNEPGATLHYTLDGSAPTKSSPIYEKPVRLDASTTVRARAYKEGFTRSITVQSTFIIEP
ncbi:MAG: hypothetical protein QOD03_1336 [Verrucomicrobiota bacterium]